MALFDKEKDKQQTTETSNSSIANMNKQQLLELLIDQTKEVERLQQEKASLEEQLQEAKQQAASYRSDLDHAYSLLRLTMRLEKIVAKLDPSYVPENYEAEVIKRVNEAFDGKNDE